MYRGANGTRSALYRGTSGQTPGLPQLRSCRVPPKAVYRGTRNLGKSAFVFEESSQPPRYDRRTITRAPRYTRPSASHRSEEHTSELQSLMRISYAVFCLKKKTQAHIELYISG